MDLAVVTPSYLGSADAAEVAARSLDSFQHHVDKPYPHFVVDDVPRLSLELGGATSIDLPVPDPRRWGLAASVYDRDGIELVRRFGRSSVTATVRAIREAMDDDADLVFLHLDDNVYTPALGPLLERARDAFDLHPDLQWIRMSGYPLLSSDCTTEDGNLTHLEVKGDRVTFGSHALEGTDHGDYTLWSTKLTPDLVEGDFWPVAGWTTVYRAEVLERLLIRNGVRNLSTLAEFESYYKERSNWTAALDEMDALEGSMGYIDMRFVGLEMEHNEDWEALIGYPNKPVRT